MERDIEADTDEGEERLERVAGGGDTLVTPFVTSCRLVRRSVDVNILAGGGSAS